MQFDRIYAAILSSQWIRLPTDLKLQLIPLLMKAQHPPLLMAGFSPLNLDTFVNVRFCRYRCVLQF